MSVELKTDDMQSLAKEHLRLMKWLIRVLAFQSIFVITLVCTMLWMMLPEISRY